MALLRHAVEGLPGAHYSATGDVIIHPLWNGEYEDGHDLALIRLPAGTVVSAAPTQVGSPWDSGANAANTIATIMGDGRTFAHDTGDANFLAADTVLRSDDYMDDIFNPWYWFDHWTSRLMIGAGSTNQTVCMGDSGGPLVVYSSGHPVQVGVASFVHDEDNCSGAAGFAELSGAQLAWGNAGGRGRPERARRLTGSGLGSVARRRAQRRHRQLRGRPGVRLHRSGHEPAPLGRHGGTAGLGRVPDDRAAPKDALLLSPVQLPALS